MQERAIHISSVYRQKIGRNLPEDFIIKFDPVLKLDGNMYHELAADRISMTYSWHNINPEYGNNTLKYSKDGGDNWKIIKFVNGMYSYDHLDEYIKQTINKNGDKPSDGTNGIDLFFVLSSYRVVIELNSGWQLDIRNSNFGDLIGFEHKLLVKTEYSSILPNITNNIDVINIACDIITDSITDARFSNTLVYDPHRQSNQVIPIYIRT